MLDLNRNPLRFDIVAFLQFCWIQFCHKFSEEIICSNWWFAWIIIETTFEMQNVFSSFSSWESIPHWHWNPIKSERENVNRTLIAFHHNHGREGKLKSWSTVYVSIFAHLRLQFVGVDQLLFRLSFNANCKCSALFCSSICVHFLQSVACLFMTLSNWFHFAVRAGDAFYQAKRSMNLTLVKDEICYTSGLAKHATNPDFSAVSKSY